MRRAGRKGVAVAERPLLGDELDRNAACGENMRERLGRKQMAAGAAGGEKRGRRGHRHRAGLGSTPPTALLFLAPASRSAFRRRLRVTARRKPMQSARESKDEPP